ncbi:MAG: hypothetical protein R3F15_07750 [Lysobacterales bacterium]
MDSALPQSPEWTPSQRAAMDVLGVTAWQLRGRTAAAAAATVAKETIPGNLTENSTAPIGWSLLAAPAQRAAIERTRWFRQLQRFAPEQLSDIQAGRAPVLLLGDRRLPLDGAPPCPSPGVKRELYLALRARPSAD